MDISIEDCLHPRHEEMRKDTRLICGACGFVLASGLSDYSLRKDTWDDMLADEASDREDRFIRP